MKPRINKHYLVYVFVVYSIALMGQNNNLIIENKVGIGTDDPKTSLHLNGDLTTPWGITWYQYQANFGVDDRFKPWLRRSWSSVNGDYLYLSGVGNRDNNQQSGILLSQLKGFIVGKGSNQGTELDTEYLKVDSNGEILINDLAGSGTRTVQVNNDGRLFLQQIPGGYTDVISIPYTSFVSILNPEQGEFNETKAYAYHEEPILTQLEYLNAVIHLPHNARIRKIESHLYDNSSDKGVAVGIYRYGSGLGLNGNGADWYKVDNSTGALDGIQVVSEDLNYAIDNINYAYVIQVRGWVDNFNDITFNWPTENVGVQKVVIYYD